MKRSSFLKSLLGIAVAPMAVVKVVESVSEVKVNPTGFIESIEDLKQLSVELRSSGHNGMVFRNHSHILKSTYNVAGIDAVEEENHRNFYNKIELDTMFPNEKLT